MENENRFDIIGIICAIALILILGYCLLALTYNAGVSEGKRGVAVEADAKTDTKTDIAE